ncbi:unnamed protein product [Allacma fusca]|uniref:O-acyltransferase WSD1 C-terminal domain-containing protein n=1 Tax=Allacma fusca TaxID=39272 RepID=A0A8J2PIP3_9HEXA|nr:unnamed protein product [Allacma fusca]
MALLLTLTTIFIPIYILRGVASLTKKIFRPDLDQMIVTHSAVLAMDDPYERPQWNLCVWIVLDRNPEINDLRETLLERVFLRKLPNGQFADPEYQQYYSKWLGFLFWKWDPDFDKYHHIRLYSEDTQNLGGIITEEKFRQILKTLTWAPFKVKTSPWECLLVNDLQLNDTPREQGTTVNLQSALIFRVHHGLCDGFSILRALMQELGKISITTAVRPHFPKKGFLRRVFEICTFPLLAPYQFSRTLVDAYDVNGWHRGGCGRLKRLNASFTPRIPTEFIKEAKDKHGVSFTAVLMSGIVGGIRNVMTQQGLEIPKNMNAAIPVPLPNHPLKLRNHWVFSFLKLPIGIEDPLRRLQKTERNIRKLKESLVPAFSFFIIPIVGGTFPGLMKIFNRNNFSTLLISNFPGPQVSEGKNFFTTKEGKYYVLDMNFNAGLGCGNVGLGLFMLSYKDGVRIVTEVDDRILPDDASVQLLNEEILKEITYLHTTSPSLENSQLSLDK